MFISIAYHLSYFLSYRCGIWCCHTRGIEINKLSNSDDFLKIERYLKNNNIQPLKKPATKQSEEQTLDCEVLIYDLETTGLKRDAEITQLACVDFDSGREFNTYIMPNGKIEPRASKVTG